MINIGFNSIINAEKYIKTQELPMKMMVDATYDKEKNI